MSSVVEILRGAASLVLFGVFGFGALLISPLMFLLRSPARCQPVVRTAWRLIVFLFEATRLIKVDRTGLHPVCGAVLAANHPSLIDVVLICAAVPRTLYVAKRSLKGNPILSAIVRHTALPDDATLPEIAASYLESGWNVLVFPEGTRSPRTGGLQPLRRGAAQLSLRTGAPIVCTRIGFSRRLLAKRQPAWDMGAATVEVSLAFGGRLDPPVSARNLRAAAAEMTARLRHELQSGPAREKITPPPNWPRNFDILH